MVIINTSDDLIRIVRENPEFRAAMRRELLTEELLDMPRRFAEFAKASESWQERMEGRMDRSESWQERSESRMDRMEKDIGDLKGISLETKLYNRGMSNIATLLKVRNIRRVRVAEQDDNSVAFNEAIQRAEDRGILSEREYERLLATDMIVRSNRRGSTQEVYVAIEATYGVTNRDVVQVKRSEDALRKVFPDAEVHPALYFFSDLPESIERRCREEDVRLIQVDSFG